MPAPDLDQPTYRCLICKDQGRVHAWNPMFLANYERKFRLVSRAEQEATQLPLLAQKYLKEGMTIKLHTYEPEDWFEEARRWWRGQERGPISEMVICDCDCKRAVRYRQEQDAHRKGERRNKMIGELADCPGAGHNCFDPETQQVRSSDPFNDLKRWYGC